MQRANASLGLNHDVIAVAAVEDIDAGSTDEHVVAIAAAQHIAPVAADEYVIAGAAIGRQRDPCGGERGRFNHIAARQSIDDKPIRSDLRASDIDLRGQPNDGNTAGIA
jgi:hypothetical protein